MTWHILLVEDSEFMQTNISNALESTQQFRVTTTVTIQDASNILTTNEEIDCIITNHNLPDGNGIEFAKRLPSKSEDEYIPVVLLTSTKLEPLSQKATNAGVAEFVRKGSHAIGDMNLLANRIKIVIKAYN